MGDTKKPKKMTSQDTLGARAQGDTRRRPICCRCRRLCRFGDEQMRVSTLNSEEQGSLTLSSCLHVRFPHSKAERGTVEITQGCQARRFQQPAVSEALSSPSCFTRPVPKAWPPPAPLLVLIPRAFATGPVRPCLSSSDA